MSLLTAVPPEFAVFALAVAVLVLSRRTGNALAGVGLLAVCTAMLVVPAGAYVRVPLFGFDAVLYRVDGYSRPLAAVFTAIGAAAVGYGHATGADRRQTAYSLAYVGSGVGAALAGDWLTLVVYWELMAAFATLVVWHTADDARVGLRYAIYHEVGGLTFMAGVLLHYARVGTFLYGDGVSAGLPALLVALGVGLNAGFVGLHAWLVDAYPRTHVAASVVLAAYTTKVGAYALVRAFPDGAVAVAYVGGVMVLFGVTFAVLQTDVRRLLSYHVVSQVGYMVAGFGAGTALAGAGAMAHLVNNVLYKSLLFMVAGVLIDRLDAESLKQYGALWRSMPRTATAFGIGAFAIAGVPGFNGFVSKGMVQDGVEAAGLDLLWWMLVVGGVGTVLSFAKFGYYAFLHGESRDVADLGPVESAAMGGVALACIVFGVAPGLLFALLPTAGVAGAKPFATSQFTKAVPVLVVGVVAFAALRPRLARVGRVPDVDALYRPAGRRLVTAAVAVVGAGEDAMNALGAASLRSVARLLGGDVWWTDPDAVRRRWGLSVRPGTIGTGVLLVALVLAVVLALLLLL